MIYLDSAATTFQKPGTVKRAMNRAMATCASPGRGGYAQAMNAAETAYACRKLAGELFDTEADHVVFTMNATHGLNLAMKSLINPGDPVVISGFEHNAVTRPLAAMGARVTVAGRRLFDWTDTLEAFERAITAGTRAVICTQVSNVFGYALPVDALAELCDWKQVPLIVDASQGAGCLPVSLGRWNAAYVAMPGHKGLYGPQGTGLLLCGDRLPRPLLEGGTGSQSRLAEMPDFLPDRLEAGTINVTGIAGLLAGLEFVSRQGTDEILRREQMLLCRMVEGLQELEGLRVFAGPEGVQTGVLSVQTGNRDCEALAAALADRGVAVRAGLHCAPLAHESAGTLDTGTLRISVSAFNTRREIDRFLCILKQCLRK